MPRPRRKALGTGKRMFDPGAKSTAHLTAPTCGPVVPNERLTVSFKHSNVIYYASLGIRFHQ